ncbi:uncharacterized protein B0T15DRAFT_528775 [Chaetomium strumarium]|uniref:rRNA-processing protein FYV7 n=1 Tax=Chaetomium strumarium TaxID=1170767 RepID=A0AAJ0M2X6_9PEZI|nr:hypothetical protein B0T15DRAFT_528775 [Chaetomium strumarium]
MCAKRARDEDAISEAGTSPAPEDTRKPKKAKHGFRVGPENLPDGPWRRKVTKIKKELITKAKVKKQYAKIKAEHQKQATASTTTQTVTEENTKAEDSAGAPARSEPQQQEHDFPPPAPAQIHPYRQAMLGSASQPSKLDNEESQPKQPDQQVSGEDTAGARPERRQQRRHPRKQRPDYFARELAAAERAKKQAEERAAELARREQERQQRIAERERYRKMMAKAKTPGKDGKRKIGREGKVLLERVKKVMGEK